VYIYTYSCIWHAKSLQFCLILYDATDCSPPDSSLQGILQARRRRRKGKKRKKKTLALSLKSFACSVTLGDCVYLRG